MMTNPQPEPKTKSVGFPFHWWWVLVLVLLVGFALFGEKGVLRLVKTYNQRTDLQHKVEQLTAENQHLKLEIEALRKDYSTIERIARQELGMVREDEIVYQFPNQKQSAQPQSAPAK
jgi:cell division protein FtsB